MSGALTGLIGGLLRGQGPDVNIMHGMIDNLSRCDVKRDGLCCYFPGICDPIARCVSEPSPSNVFELGQSIPKCVCPEGFEGDGRTKGTGCTNIDECFMGIAQCEQLCTDLIPGYQCQCKSGFRLNQDGRSCRDINECLEHTDKCTQTCTNTHGSYKCGCHQGYRLDPNDQSSCLEVDECEEASITGVSVCQFDSLCVNLPGTYQCGCPPGLEPMESDARRCVDRNECLTMEKPCPMSHVKIDGREFESQMCENLFGGWSCLCLPGSRQRREVETLSLIEERDALMYSAEDLTWRFQRAQKLASEIECEDINECEEDPGLCLPLTRRDGDGEDLETRDARLQAVCQNSFRGYTCACPVEGLVYDRHTRMCVDVNECVLGMCGTDPRMRCTNLEPGFECACEKGYLKRDTKTTGLLCVDINECQQDLSPCPPGSQCVNTPGSFQCTCEPGYEAITHELVDGTTALYRCVDIDECALGMCPAPCMNVAGSFYCGCPRGTAAVDHHLPDVREKWSEMVAEAAIASSWTEKTFRALSSTIAQCVDIDECQLTNGGVCGQSCSCLNTDGAYTCDTNEVDRSFLVDDRHQLMHVSQTISQNLAELPLLAIITHLRPDELFIGLASSEGGGALWHLMQIDWLTSGRFEFDEINSGTVSRLLASLQSRSSALEALVEVFGDVLLTTQQLSCRAKRKCTDMSIQICTKVNAPCCRDLPNGTFQCVPGKYRLTSRRPICPPDTIDRLTA